MAMAMDQQQQQQQEQQTYKHHCRICKKGFGCGRALGGHMRAHGINDDSVGNNADQDDDPSGCSDWGPADDRTPSNKRMYALRTNVNRLKSCRVCENCGKEFASWKSFLDHGKCSSDDEPDDYFMSSPSDAGDDDSPAGHRNSAGWSKGKRSRRASYKPAAACPSSEEEDLANCLMLLSSARVDPVFVAEPEESCASASKDEDRRHSHQIPNAEKSKAPALQAPSNAVPKGMFECKACKKVFTSHQALGGHRASHKKVKGCFAAKLDADPSDEPPPEDETMMTNDNASHDAAAAAAAMAMEIVPFNNVPLAVAPLRKKSKVHECSICHRQFASGQALGGHKRCHWITSTSGGDPNPMAKLQAQMQHEQQANINRRASTMQHVQRGQQRHELTLGPMFDASDTLDLNLPAPAEMRQDIGSPLRLDVPAALYLQQPWVDHKNKASASGCKNKNNSNAINYNTNNNNVNNDDYDDNKNDNNEAGCSVNNNDDDDNNNNNGNDEGDGQVKLAKLSELKDMNGGGEVSPWLQVGIGSSGNEGSEP